MDVLRSRLFQGGPANLKTDLHYGNDSAGNVDLE